MTAKQEKDFRTMYMALQKIARAYMNTVEIRKYHRTGLDFEEFIEMAYDNIQAEAKQALRGVRLPKEVGIN